MSSRTSARVRGNFDERTRAEARDYFNAEDQFKSTVTGGAEVFPGVTNRNRSSRVTSYRRSRSGLVRLTVSPVWNKTAGLPASNVRSTFRGTDISFPSKAM